MMPNNSTGTLKPNAPDINMANIRHDPDGALKTSLPIGTQVSVIQESADLDTNGFKWFKIGFGPGSDQGWVRSDLIDIDNPIAPIATPNPKPPQKNTQVPTAQNTMLFFETDPTTIRVFQGSDRLYMNIFDKSSNKAQQVEAIRLPESRDETGLLWQSYYVANYDDKSFAARFIPLSDPSSKAELIVSDASNGSLISRDPGWKIEGKAYT